MHISNITATTAEADGVKYVEICVNVEEFGDAWFKQKIPLTDSSTRDILSVAHFFQSVQRGILYQHFGGDAKTDTTDPDPEILKKCMEMEFLRGGRFMLNV